MTGVEKRGRGIIVSNATQKRITERIKLMYQAFDNISVNAETATTALHLLRSRHRLDVAAAYNRGVEIGRAEVADNILKQQAGNN